MLFLALSLFITANRRIDYPFPEAIYDFFYTSCKTVIVLLE